MNYKKHLQKAKEIGIDPKPKRNQLYINIEDYQNGCWFVGVYGTLKQWRKQAMEWADLDENYEIYNLLKYYKIKNKDLLYFINDYWTIGIIEYDQTKNPKEYGLEQEYLHYLGDK